LSKTASLALTQPTDAFFAFSRQDPIPASSLPPRWEGWLALLARRMVFRFPLLLLGGALLGGALLGGENASHCKT